MASGCAESISDLGTIEILNSDPARLRARFVSADGRELQIATRPMIVERTALVDGTERASYREVESIGAGIEVQPRFHDVEHGLVIDLVDGELHVEPDDDRRTLAPDEREVALALALEGSRALIESGTLEGDALHGFEAVEEISTAAGGAVAPCEWDDDLIWIGGPSLFGSVEISCESMPEQNFYPRWVVTRTEQPTWYEFWRSSWWTGHAEMNVDRKVLQTPLVFDTENGLRHEAYFGSIFCGERGVRYRYLSTFALLASPANPKAAAAVHTSDSVYWDTLRCGKEFDYNP